MIFLFYYFFIFFYYFGVTDEEIHDDEDSGVDGEEIFGVFGDVDGVEAGGPVGGVGAVNCHGCADVEPDFLVGFDGVVSVVGVLELEGLDDSILGVAEEDEVRASELGHLRLVDGPIGDLERRDVHLRERFIRVNIEDEGRVVVALFGDEDFSVFEEDDGVEIAIAGEEDGDVRGKTDGLILIAVIRVEFDDGDLEFSEDDDEVAVWADAHLAVHLVPGTKLEAVDVGQIGSAVADSVGEEIAKNSTGECSV